MKRYWIKNKDDEYWSRNKEFGYWSKFNDDSSIKNRMVYPYFMGKLQQFAMKCYKIETDLEEVKN